MQMKRRADGSLSLSRPSRQCAGRVRISSNADLPWRKIEFLPSEALQNEANLLGISLSGTSKAINLMEV